MKARSRSAPGSQARPLPHREGQGEGDPDLQAPGTGVASNEVFHEVLRVVEDGLIFIAGWDRYKQMGRCRIALNFWYRWTILQEVRSPARHGPLTLATLSTRDAHDMSTTSDLVTALKAELKAAGITYAALAERLGMAGVQRQAHVLGERRHAAVAGR